MTNIWVQGFYGNRTRDTLQLVWNLLTGPLPLIPRAALLEQCRERSLWRGQRDGVFRVLSADDHGSYPWAASRSLASELRGS